MKAWLRIMLTPIFRRRCAVWAGPGPGHIPLLLRRYTRFVRSAAPAPTLHKSPDTRDGLADVSTLPGVPAPFERLGGGHATGSSTKDSFKTGRGNTADDFAEFMSSHRKGIQPEDAVIWYSVIQDAGIAPVMNANYYSQLDNYPYAEEYPELPPLLFQRPPTLEGSARLSQLVKHHASIDASYELVKRPERYIWRRIIAVVFKGIEIVAKGEDDSRDKAHTAGTAHLLQQLHESRLLHYLSPLDGAKVKEEKVLPTPSNTDLLLTQKIHVYNYAARFGVIPAMSQLRIAEDHVVATVSLPELGLQATASSKTYQDAEAVVYTRLKEAIEEKHANSSTKPLVLREPGYVCLDNSNDILAYYQYIHRPQKFKWEVRRTDPLNSSSWFSASVFWEGKQIAAPGIMPTANRARWLAALIAAATLVKAEPDLFKRYEDAMFQQGVATLRKHLAVPVLLAGSTEAFLNETTTVMNENIPAISNDKFNLQDHRGSIERSQRTIASAIRMKDYNHMTKLSLDTRSEQLKMKLEVDLRHPRIKAMKKMVANLPVNERRSEILSLIKNNAQCIVIGTAGSGKSTQVPQMILDDAIVDGRGAHCNIIHTQPRRTSAVALAIRVSQERNEGLGDLVGYRIAGDAKECELGGRITFCTPEMLNIQLEAIPDEVLDDTSHIIIDEVHELEEHTSILLMVLKLAFSARLRRGATVPKLILMSATLQSELIESYFELTDESGSSTRPPVITVPGRQYPVEHKLLEGILPELQYTLNRSDLDVIIKHPVTEFFISKELGYSGGREHPSSSIDWRSQAELEAEKSHHLDSVGLVAANIAHLTQSTQGGDILVFLSGWNDLIAVDNLLRKSFKDIQFADPDQYAILLVHSSNPSAIAEAMEDPIEGRRRILLATNIAETSHTFPYVKYVIDSGKSRQNRYSDNSLSNTLFQEWEGKASITQRAGRVGRVGPGKYYGLYSQQRLASMTDLAQNQAMHLADVQLTCLRAGRFHPSVPLRQYISQLLNPPPTRYVEAAIATLQSFGALTQEETISDIGFIIARLRCTPAMGRMLLLGILFRCLEPLLVVVALEHCRYQLLGRRELQETAAQLQNFNDFRVSYSKGTGSDQIAHANIFLAYKHLRDNEGPGAAQLWLSEHGLDRDKLEEVDSQVKRLRHTFERFGFVRWDNWETSEDPANARAGNYGLLKALIMTSLHPNIALQDHGNPSGSKPIFYTRLGNRTAVSHWSSARTYGSHVSLCCYTLMHSSSIWSATKFLSYVTPVSPIAAVLFGTSIHLKKDDDNILVVDGWIPVQVSGGPNAARTLLKFKQQLDQSLTIALQMLCNPRKRRQGNFKSLELILQTVTDLLEYDEQRWQQTIQLDAKNWRKIKRAVA